MEKITIKAFRAVDEPELCRTYADEHARVLKDIGVDQVVKPDADWALDPNTIVICALHAELGMVGGFRIQFDKPDRPIPMRRALDDMGISSATLIHMLEEGTAEMTALWNANRFAGRGLPLLLMSATVAVAGLLPLKHLTIFVAEYMAPYALRAGGLPIEDIGTSGRLNYPIAGIHSFALVTSDLQTLVHAAVEERNRIVALRLNHRLERVEKPRAVELLVSYCLCGALGQNSFWSNELNRAAAA